MLPAGGRGAGTAPGIPLIGNNIVFYSVIGGALLLLLLLILWVRRGRRPPVDPEAALIENLGDYPPAGPGPQRLFLHGHPMRVRLVVLAPMGKRPLPANGAVEPLLDQVLRGLGDIARQDRPRLRVWPPQLSSQGFAPTFFRLTRRPEAGRQALALGARRRSRSRRRSAVPSRPGPVRRQSGRRDQHVLAVE